MPRIERAPGEPAARPSWRADLRAAALPWIVSRVLVLVALGTARRVVDHVGARSRPIALGQGLLGWDAAFYGDIARGGYGAVDRGGLRFFPLLPLLGRAVGWLPGLDARGGVVVIVNAAALVAAVLLVRLVTMETGDRALAVRCAMVLLLAPHAFVFVMGYAESLLCATALAMFLGLRRERWWLAAIAGFAAGLCRPLGVLLVLPALIEAVRAWRSGSARVAPAVAVLSPGLGMLAYLLWVRDRTGDFFLALRLQNSSNLRGGNQLPVRSVAHAFHELLSGERVGYGLHAITVVVVIVLVVVAARRLPASYTVYAGAAVGVALCARNLDSLERYSLSTFPLVIAAAALLRRPAIERVAMILIASGLVAAAVLAFTGALVP